MSRWALLCAAALLRIPATRSFGGFSRQISHFSSTRPSFIGTSSFFHVPTDLSLSLKSEYACSDSYFIRKAMISDMGEAARILAEGFYGNSDFIVKKFEQFKTFLSLDSDFPRDSIEQHQVLVACRASDGRVIAMCDVDNRLKCDVRPYMCNLGVDPNYRQQGIAQALILESERIVRDHWHLRDSHLKVKEKNEAAVALYKKLGYTVISQGIDPKSGDVLLTMRKELVETVDHYARERRITKNETLVLD